LLDITFPPVITLRSLIFIETDVYDLMIDVLLTLI